MIEVDDVTNLDMLRRFAQQTADDPTSGKNYKRLWLKMSRAGIKLEDSNILLRIAWMLRSEGGDGIDLDAHETLAYMEMVNGAFHMAVLALVKEQM